MAILLIIYHYRLSLILVSFHFLSSSCYLQSVKSVQKPSGEKTAVTPTPVVSIT